MREKYDVIEEDEETGPASGDDGETALPEQCLELDKRRNKRRDGEGHLFCLSSGRVSAVVGLVWFTRLASSDAVEFGINKGAEWNGMTQVLHGATVVGSDGVTDVRDTLARKGLFILGRRIEIDERREDDSDSAIDSSRPSKMGTVSLV